MQAPYIHRYMLLWLGCMREAILIILANISHSINQVDEIGGESVDDCVVKSDEKSAPPGRGGATPSMDVVTGVNGMCCIKA